MKKPELPILVAGTKDFSLWIENTGTHFKQLTRLAYLRQKQESGFYFDKSGHKWQLTYRNPTPYFKINMVNRLLANSFYNPVIQADLDWTDLGEYALDELRSRVIHCIEKDDDILTQFIDATFLIAKIQRVGSVEELLDALNKYCFEADENTIPEEFND